MLIFYSLGLCVRLVCVRSTADADLECIVAKMRFIDRGI